MVKLTALVNSDQIIIHYSKYCIFGTFENEEKWMFYSIERENKPVPEMYAIDYGFHTVEFNEEDIPHDYQPGKYKLNDNGEFILNPDWDPPIPVPDPIEVRLSKIENGIVDIEDALLDLSSSLDT